VTSASGLRNGGFHWLKKHEGELHPNRPPTAPGAHPVAYTEKFAKLGLAMDQYEAAHGH
jgi:hypothetical protein